MERDHGEPGTRIGYHAITWGYVVGEIIRRATGKPIPQALREEVAERLGVTNELFFAVRDAEQRRVARLEDAPGSEEMFGELPEDSPIFKLGSTATSRTENIDPQRRVDADGTRRNAHRGRYPLALG
jgi:CubicO group peptidase (beta-lactamase class C family)